MPANTVAETAPATATQAVTDLLNRGEHVHLISSDDTQCLSLPTCQFELLRR